MRDCGNGGERGPGERKGCPEDLSRVLNRLLASWRKTCTRFAREQGYGKLAQKYANALRACHFCACCGWFREWLRGTLLSFHAARHLNRACAPARNPRPLVPDTHPVSSSEMFTFFSCMLPPSSFVLRATLSTRSEQLGGNKYLLADGLFIAKMLGRTLIEYPAKDAR